MANSVYLSSKLIAYPDKGKRPALAAVDGRQLGLFNIRAVNHSGASATVGLGRLQGTGTLNLLSVETAGPTYAALTFPTGAAPQQIFDGSASQGFVVGSFRPLGLIGVTVSAPNGGGTFEIQQWNGSSWVLAGSVLEQPAAYGSAQDEYHVLRVGIDHVKGGDDALLTEDKYWTRVIATGAPSGAVAISDLWAMSFLELREGVIDNGQAKIQFDWRQPFQLEAGESFAPYFSVASADNQAGAFWTLAGQ